MLWFVPFLDDPLPDYRDDDSSDEVSDSELTELAESQPVVANSALSMDEWAKICADAGIELLTNINTICFFYLPNTNFSSKELNIWLILICYWYHITCSNEGKIFSNSSETFVSEF